MYICYLLQYHNNIVVCGVSVLQTMFQLDIQYLENQLHKNIQPVSLDAAFSLIYKVLLERIIYS